MHYAPLSASRAKQARKGVVYRCKRDSGHRLHVLALAMSLLLGQSVSAQTATPPSKRYIPVVNATVNHTPPVTVLDGQYAANAQIARIHATVRNAGVPADGSSELIVDITVFDAQNQAITEPVLITIEHSGGRLQMLGAPSDEFGPTRKDADRSVPGTQIKLVGGQASFSLIAPSQPQDVTLRLTGGQAQLVGVVPFEADIREMIAAGLIEGSLRLSKRSSASTISPARVDDGFEQAISHFSRSQTSANGNQRTVDARASMFLKGKIAGETLLTLSFDTDKETRSRLLRDIKPEEFYPVYGDASIRGFEARSSDKVYVRIDQQRSFVMYGDYNTGEGFAQMAGSGVVAGTDLRQLSAYNRTLTGLRAHQEGSSGFVNGFAAYDTLKNLTEELRANGTSGPFAVRNANAVENSEKIELLVRDRRQLNVVLSVTPLTRLNDYVFEPFSGRILLTRPVPSVDADGNPLSLRISYEVDQGGDNYLVAGVDGQFNVSPNVVIGGAYTQDKNPNAPISLAGVYAGMQLGDKTTVVAELAQSKALPAATATSTATSAATQVGKAQRIVLTHQGDAIQGSAYINRSDASFINTSNGAAAGAGTQQVGGKVNASISPRLSVNAQTQVTDDLASQAYQRSASVGVQLKLSELLSVRAGLARNQTQGTVGGILNATGCNPAPGSAYSPASSGGFSGAGSGTLLNVNNANGANGANGVNATNDCNNVLNPSISTSSIASAVPTMTQHQSDTLQLGVDAKITARVTASATLELGNSTDTNSSGQSNTDKARHLELAIAYQLAERARLYLRADTQRGLANPYSLNNNTDKTTTFALGLDASYMQGGQIFSEYRLRDAVGGQESQLASGLRNAWLLRDGVLLSTSAERLKQLSGSASMGQNATAFTLGLDYTASELWKAGSKLEWRRLDQHRTGDITLQDTLLVNVNAARKLDRDWTALLRNYYLSTNNHGSQPNGWQDRFQLGVAYRPVDTNRFDALGKLEYKTESNINGADEYRKVLVSAMQGNWHPSRPWWLTGRLAAKSVNERFPSTTDAATGTVAAGVSDRYSAYLLAGRLVYDLTEKLDLGLTVGFMSGHGTGQTGRSVQKGLGLEAGYALGSNVWASAGYNVQGYTDKDLTSDYTGKGAYLRLRYKFDQDIFQANNPLINNTLERK
jgi:hypothetical protein